MHACVTVRPVVIVALVGALAGCGTASSTSTSQRAASSASATSTDPGWGSSASAPSVDLDAVGASAQRAVQSYYDALDAQDFQTAWSRLSGGVQSQFGGYDTWTRGYANSLSQTLISVSADATDANHATVTIALRSRDRDACGSRVAQRWSGTWTLARPDGRWIARAVSISRSDGETPVTDASACPSTDRTTQTSTPSSGDTAKVCYPGVTIPAVTIRATTIPAVTIPATTIGGVHYPAQHLPAQRLPAQHLPAQHIGGGCFEAPSAFALDQTTELDDSAYPELDPAYSAALTRHYHTGSGSSYSYPDPTAPGFGELNAAGFPKNQYVRPYVRRDGTMVSGYWRNSPSDGLPTCSVIIC